MKQRIFLLLLLTTCIPVFSQVSLTFEDNAPQTGDSNYYFGIQYVEPGPAGNNVSWDFSTIQADNKDFISHYPGAPGQILTGTAPFNLVMADNGYEYYLQNQEDKLVEVAMTKGNMTFIYSDPIVKMRYPLAYGHEFVDNFTGNAFFPDRPAYLVNGSFSMIADARGTLKFPGIILQQVLRTKQLRVFTEVHSCNTLSSHQEVYKWYAPGYRYPVLAVSIVTNQADNHAQVVTKSAYLNLNQDNTSDTTLNPVTHTSSSVDEVVPVSVYPNPFIDNLSYLYFLKERAGFSLAITDVYGNQIRQLIDNQQQNKGMHSAELDLSPYTLLPGVYFLKFSFDKKVITRKVVKIL